MEQCVGGGGVHRGALAIPDDPLPWPGIVLANWDDARRAERYRVLKQVVGTDAAPVLVTGTLHENELTLQGLPSGQAVKITVLAVNTSGDGPATVSEAFPVG